MVTLIQLLTKCCDLPMIPRQAPAAAAAQHSNAAPYIPELCSAAATNNDTHTLVSSGADLMAAGTEPDSWLLPRSIFVRPVRPAHSPGSDGMDPVKPLPFRKLQQQKQQGDAQCGR
jgi:hypothetical protein